jgi:cysteine-rich repeat protein
MYTCTKEEGMLSVCTPITCGNGKLDPNEECDDFNFLNNDGCT